MITTAELFEVLSTPGAADAVHQPPRRGEKEAEGLSRLSESWEMIIVAVEYLRNVPHAPPSTKGGEFKYLLTSPRPQHSPNTQKAARIFRFPAGEGREGPPLLPSGGSLLST